MFQDEAPLLRAHAPRPSQTRGLWPSTWLLLEAMGAGPTGRITYAAGGRLDGIGRRAIGDMVSSAVASSSRSRWRQKGNQPKHYRPRLRFAQTLQRSQIRNDRKDTQRDGRTHASLREYPRTGIL